MTLRSHGESRREHSAGRPSVPITVLARTGPATDLIRLMAADVETSVIGSVETIASAGLLGLVRSGRAHATSPDVASHPDRCVCCELRVDLIDAVRRAVLVRTPPQRLVIVIDQLPSSGEDPPRSSDEADVVTALHTLQSHRELERLTHVDGLVVHVDGRTLSTRLTCGITPWSGREEAALAIADHIAVSGADLLTASALSRVMRWLEGINSVGRILRASEGEEGRQGLFDLRAWHHPHAKPVEGVPTIESLRLRGAARSSESSVKTIVLRRPDVLDADAALGWLRDLVAEEPCRLLRVKASFLIGGGERLRVCGVRSTIRSSAAATPSPGRARGESVVWLVGRGLDPHSISNGFESIERTQ